MTTTSEPQVSEPQVSEPQVSEPQVSEPSPFATLAEALEAAAAASAQSDATGPVKAAAAKFQSGVGKGAYYTTYGVSYGVVFSGVFLKELLPDHSSLRRGLEQGARDGAKAALGVWGRFDALPDDALVNEGAPAAGATAQ